MSEFKAALGAFFTGDLDLEGLKRALADELATHPDRVTQRLSDVDRLHRMGRLPVQIHRELLGQIEATTGVHGDTAASPAGEASPPAGAAGAAAPPPSAPGAGEGSGPAPPGDRTVLVPRRPRRPEAGSGDTAAGAQPGSTVFKPASRPGSRSRRAGGGSDTLPGGRGGSAAGRTGSGGAPGSFAGASRAEGTGGTGGTGSDWQHPEDWAEDDRRIGVNAVIKDRFVLEKVLGGGGMGTVYMARDLRYAEADDRNPHVALKVLNEDFKRHPKSLQALHREARKSQSLAHPNIVTVYDFDRDGSTVFVTMEMLTGKPLNELIADNKLTGLPKAEALPLIRDMARALAHAHRKGIIHSDFKPSNAFLTDEGIVKVLDFGIARAVPKEGHQSPEEKTRFDVREEIGGYTLAYASLEMLRDEEPDPRDDVYALGCTAYELLAGRHPFGKLSAQQALDADLEPKKIRGLNGREWRAVRRALEFDRDKRTPSVDAFLEELLPSSDQRPLIIGMATAAGLLLAVVGGVYVSGQLETRRIERLRATLQNGAMVAVGEALEETARLSDDAQLRVLGDPRVQPVVQQYFLERVNEAIDASAGNYDFARAQSLIAQYRSLAFYTARDVEEIEDLVLKRRSEAEIALQQRYEAALAANRLLPVDGEEDVTDVIARLRQVDPDFSVQDDRTLLDAYLAQGRALVEGETPDLARAMRYAEQGLAFAPDDTALGNLRDDISFAMAEAERRARAEEIRTLLAGSGFDDLADFQRARPLVDELRQLAPQDPLLTRLQTSAESVLGREIDERVGERRWADARNLLSQYAELASEDFQQQQRSRVAAAEAAFGERIDGLFAELDSAARERRFDQAAALLEELEAAGADRARLQQGRDLVAQRYLALSRESRQAQDFDQAREFVALARGQSPGEALLATLESELRFIDEAAQRARERASEQAEQERMARVTETAAQFEQLLARGDFDLAAAQRAKSLLDDELASLDPLNPLLDQGPLRIGERLADAARALGEQNRWEEALALSGEALALVPQSTVLRQAQRDLTEGRSEAQSRERERAIADRKADAETLLAQERFDDEGWVDRLRSEIQAAGAASGDEAWTRTMNRRAGGALLDAAMQRRLDQRYADAQKLLKLAATFDADLPGLAEERQAVEEGLDVLRAEREEQRRLAEVEKRKRAVLNFARAGQFAQAREELSQLGDAVPESDGFRREQVPEAFAAGYRALAASAARDGDYARALRFVEEGLSYSPQDSGLLAVQVEYREQLAGALERGVAAALEAAGPLQLEALRTQLDELRGLTGSGFAAISQRLGAGALETLQAMGATDAARQRLADLQALFPGDEALASVYIEPPREDPCSRRLAGYGARNRYTCRDELPRGRGPVLVVVPDGSIGGFAISKYEISVGEYNRYCESAGCRTVPGDPALPVTGISFDDAVGYVQWMSETTGFVYGIPTREQWLYAASAGGGDPGTNFNCRLRVSGRLVRGGALEAHDNPTDKNAWGLEHHVGNAQEWVREGGGVRAVGGSYLQDITECSVELSVAHSGGPDERTGFRVIRELAADSGAVSLRSGEGE